MFFKHKKEIIIQNKLNECADQLQSLSGRISVISFDINRKFGELSRAFELPQTQSILRSNEEQLDSLLEKLRMLNSVIVNQADRANEGEINTALGELNRLMGTNPATNREISDLNQLIDRIESGTQDLALPHDSIPELCVALRGFQLEYAAIAQFNAEELQSVIRCVVSEPTLEGIKAQLRQLVQIRIEALEIDPSGILNRRVTSIDTSVATLRTAAEEMRVVLANIRKRISYIEIEKAAYARQVKARPSQQTLRQINADFIRVKNSGEILTDNAGVLEAQISILQQLAGRIDGLRLRGIDPNSIALLEAYLKKTIREIIENAGIIETEIAEAMGPVLQTPTAAITNESDTFELDPELLDMMKMADLLEEGENNDLPPSGTGTGVGVNQPKKVNT